MDHFGPGIELLDINTDEEQRVVNFTCFTEKVQKRGATSNEGEQLMPPCFRFVILLTGPKPY